MKRMKMRFETHEGDYVKLKGERYYDENNQKKNTIYYGTILDVSRTGFLGVKIDENDKRNDYPLGLTVYIDRRQVLQVYSAKIVQHLSPRLALKNIWSDFVFREVKISKCNNLMHVEYRYIGKIGFEKVKRFHSLEQAYSNVSPEYHSNVVPCYADFFGFTTIKAVRNNDNYYDREIFFSKKCYCELDWSNNPTGDFMLNERGFNNESPLPDTLICGIVENGEKGLFYRKWFICSKEFLTLWTMVCDPGDSSLSETVYHEVDPQSWNRIEKPKKRPKDLDKLMKELDTSFYSVNLKLDLKERRRKYMSHNLERAALYYPNRYKQIADILFSKNLSKNLSKSEEFHLEDLTKFQKKLIKNILWSKRVK